MSLKEFIELNLEKCVSLCKSLHLEPDEENLLQIGEYLMDMI